jgi:phage terminase large subunit-like protein
MTSVGGQALSDTPVKSLVGALTALPEMARRRFVEDASADELAELYFVWREWARPSQLPPPGDWRVWLLLAGRGFGKTRAGAEYVRARVKEGARRIALVGPTAEDTRDVMVEGDSGILAVSPPDEGPRYVRSKRRVVWPNGAVAVLYSADEPRRLRGPQHDTAWCDELAAWRYPESWDMLMFGLRAGTDPRCVVTTTPRPIRLLRELLADPKVAVTRGTTYDNREFLAPAFFGQIVRKYEGTRLGRQELQAEILEDLPGALWSRGIIEACRSPVAPAELARVVVAIDPAARSGETANETGIIVAGKDGEGQGWVLADLSGRYPPAEWAKAAIAAYRAHRADRIVAEVNNGGDMVEATLRMVDPNVPFRAVHASRGKVARAEPVATLYEQGRVRHLGTLPLLEDQMCAFMRDAGFGSAPGLDGAAASTSPDRVDALVWALSDLLVQPMPHAGIFERYQQLAAAANDMATGSTIKNSMSGKHSMSGFASSRQT